VYRQSLRTTIPVCPHYQAFVWRATQANGQVAIIRAAEGRQVKVFRDCWCYENGGSIELGCWETIAILEISPKVLTMLPRLCYQRV
jgi:hypothetical protein